MKLSGDPVAFWCRSGGLPEPVREHRFHDKRRWRFDWAWPDRKVALEFEGGVWTKGAHVRGGHYESDCEKYSEAALAGWVVLRCTTGQFKSGVWMDWLERALRPGKGVKRERGLLAKAVRGKIDGRPARLVRADDEDGKTVCQSGGQRVVPIGMRHHGGIQDGD